MLACKRCHITLTLNGEHEPRPQHVGSGRTSQQGLAWATTAAVCAWTLTAHDVTSPND